MAMASPRLKRPNMGAAISRPANAAILVELRIDMEDRGGKIEIMMPYATLEPIRDLLLQSPLQPRSLHLKAHAGLHNLLRPRVAAT